MTEFLRTHRWLWLLAGPTLLAFFLLLTRMFYTQEGRFLFLVWNLFLAFVPLGIAYLIKSFSFFQRRFIYYPTLLVWLLFLPNAPYILTDLLHLQYTQGMAVWFDMTLILTFAWTGLVAGFYSLKWVHHSIHERFRGRAWLSWSFAVMCVFASSYGIFLGRFLRWNSWDVLDSPGSLLREIVRSLTHRGELFHTYGFTLSFGALLLFMYLMANGATLKPETKGL